MCCFKVSLCGTKCESSMAIMLRTKELENKENFFQTPEKIVLQSGCNGLTFTT